MQEKSHSLWSTLLASTGLWVMSQLSGCAGMPLDQTPQQTTSTPPENEVSVTPPNRHSRSPVQVESYPQPVIPRHSQAQPSKAAQALSARARHQMDNGERLAAAASLERALRIDPRNPGLWNQLAHVRKAQGQDAQAANLAARSNALPGVDAQLRADNRKLMRN